MHVADWLRKTSLEHRQVASDVAQFVPEDDEAMHCRTLNDHVRGQLLSKRQIIWNG